ncbi:hypothetical protein EZV62_001088 [Acer yangbiense]|uniref:Uncharacterized protein n=1 Tax=Acer yangbiense TaxID=1000413 RepID=A0A5C7ITR2_9ROSI|nr:hypothetical protein EZV62_001088 [Acer yangbiense]
MDAAEVAKLYENLSIADEDGAALEVLEEATVDGVKDVELVVNNTFMFYFINQEDRNRIWQMGPWHFRKSLIVLEKSKGSGNIARLGFNKADFWIQIHDFPILCMNRRTAKWLAEQIGEVVEIPSDSRECWGQLMRVKVRVDISKPLKRWLRLKLDKSEEVTMERVRSMEGSREGNGDGSDSRKLGSLDSYKVDQVASTATISGKWRDALIPIVDVGPSNVEEMCVDGPGVRLETFLSGLGCPNKDLNNKTRVEEEDSNKPTMKTPLIETHSFTSKKDSSDLALNQDQQNEILNPLPSPSKKATRKWKRHARERKHQQKQGIITSPFHRLLEISKSPVKTPNGKVVSPLAAKKNT